MADDDEFSELREADIDSVHAVGKAANGTTILFAKQAEGAEGVFGADFVRDMIAKGDGGETAVAGERFTAAQAMALVHAASVRKADMSTADINDLPDSAFAHVEPGGTKDASGKTTPRSKRHYAVHDAAHVRNALARASQQMGGGDADGKRIAAAAMPKIKAAAKKLGVQVAKSDFLDFSGGELGDGAEAPGSPAWEAQDASAAQGLIKQILAIIPGVKALAQRESTEVAAGHADDMDDVCNLEQVCDALMCAAQMLGAFAVTETAEAGEMAKAAPAPTDSAATATPTSKENAVSNADGTQDTNTQAQTDEVAKGTGLTAEDLAELKALAEYGRAQMLKKAAKAAKTSDAEASDGARTIPGTDTVQDPAQAPDEVTKAEANQFATALAEVMAPVVKQLGELAAKVNAQGERVEKMASQPDDRKSPMLNGATGEPMLAQRGKGLMAHPEVQAIVKSINDMEDGAAKDNARQALGYAAVKARFAPNA